MIEPRMVMPPVIQRSPWGHVQHQYNYTKGINFVSTASHGGFKIDSKVNQLIPIAFRRNNGWYEEDCDASIIVFFFPNIFNEEKRKQAESVLKNYLWRQYEQHFNVTIPIEESYCKKSDIKFCEDNGL